MKNFSRCLMLASALLFSAGAHAAYKFTVDTNLWGRAGVNQVTFVHNALPGCNLQHSSAFSTGTGNFTSTPGGNVTLGKTTFRLMMLKEDQTLRSILYFPSGSDAGMRLDLSAENPGKCRKDAEDLLITIRQ